MEIEKPFKCPGCNARFTNEDHLFVHKRRHEMSLNLKAGGQPTQQQHSLDSFVDETPTPTRFFRNCEEVGLFQDLQNVNPFDESFAKASGSGGTPSASTTSTGGVGVDQFDFSIALPSSATVVPGSGEAASSSSSEYSLASKRRYSDHDTLNTPQVFLGGYNYSTSTPTATNFSSTTTTVLNPVPSGAGGNNKDANAKVLTLARTDGDNYTQTTQEDQKLLSHSSGTTTKSQKPKTSLKLNLSPIASMILSDANSSDDSGRIQSVKCIQPPDEPEKKTELLERNRAASSRSRQRRKQWVYNLESRCLDLEKLLAQAKAENQILRTELTQTLSKHANCNITQSQNGNEMETPKLHGIEIVLVQSKSTEPSIIIPNTDILPGEALSCPSLLIPKPKIPAKRGRPRKGQERRVQGFCFPTTPSLISSPAKLPLLPSTPIIGRSADE